MKAPSKQIVTYQHETMPDNDHLIQLDGLFNEGRQRLQPLLLSIARQCSCQVGIVQLWQLNTREQIAKDTCKGK
jgi:hypothetical protein